MLHAFHFNFYNYNMLMCALELFEKHSTASKSAKKRRKAPKSTEKHQKAQKAPKSTISSKLESGKAQLRQIGKQESTIQEKNTCFPVPWQSRGKQGKHTSLLLSAKIVCSMSPCVYNKLRLPNIQPKLQRLRRWLRILASFQLSLRL